MSGFKVGYFIGSLATASIVPREADASEAAASLRGPGFEASRDASGWLARDPWGTSLRITA
jgi:hypothetical protein